VASTLTLGTSTRHPERMSESTRTSASSTTDRARRIAVTGGALFDGVSETLRPSPVIILDQGRIVAVETGAEPPADCEVHDLGNATLLPGLVDTHVHLAFDASTEPVANLAARDDDAVVESMTQAARTAVLGGVTTVRDLGDRNYLSLQLRGRPDLPTILCAGPPITTIGGHCHFLGGAIEDGVDHARAAVRDHAERGVDVIKIMASGGNLTPGTHQELAQFTPEEMVALVDEAHRLGLPVTAHAHATAGVANAVAAGVDGLEHVSFWSAEGVDSPIELMQLITDRRIVVGATAGLDPAKLAIAAPPPELAVRIPGIIANLARMVAMGAVVVVGTDAGIAPPKPHDVLRHALPMMQMGGLAPIDALRAITSVAAAACGLGTVKGRLESGFDADILAVDGDPVADPDALHRIQAVYARGIRMR
jgi:imidazolonepropionase-like amidohydrolase